MTETPILEVRNLCRYFPVRGGVFRRVVAQLKAVENVSFAIGRGRTLGLVGESGCGKSTLGRAVLHLQKPTSGQVFLDGEEITSMSRRELFARRRSMQIIFQDPYASLSPRRTVGQTLREPLDNHRVGEESTRDGRVRELLDVVGLREQVLTRYPHEFSGGQRQRVGIARALALNPKFIVADEPVSALDVSVQSQVLNLIARLQVEQGISFLFIAHDLAVVQHISHDVGVMYLGQLVEMAAAPDLYREPLHPYTRALMSAVPETDPKARRQRIVLSGDVPSPVHPPSGCPFHNRCPEVMKICSEVVPPEFVVGGSETPHLVRCHLYADAAQTSPGVRSLA